MSGTESPDSESVQDTAGLSDLELTDIIDDWVDSQDEILPGVFSTSAAHPDSVHTSMARLNVSVDLKKCWGGIIQETHAHCTPGFEVGAGHFKHKLCPNCQLRGISVAATRVCTLPPNTEAHSNVGVWNLQIGGSEHGQCRVINHTARCVGPRLAIFRGPAPPLNGPAMPECWARDGVVRLLLSKGTLVPAAVTRDAKQIASLRDTSLGTAPQGHAKRPRQDDRGPNRPPDPPAAPADGQPDRQSGPPTATPLFEEGPPAAAQLLASHEQLLHHLSAHLSAVDGLTAQGVDNEGHAEVVAETHDALVALLDPLATSTAVLRRAVYRASSPTEPPSFPPSPPLSRPSTAGSARRAGTAARPQPAPVESKTPPWRTPELGSAECAADASTNGEMGRGWPAGPLTCLRELLAAALRCMTVLFCCPTLLAQLWSKRMLRRSPPKQRRAACVTISLLLWMVLVSTPLGFFVARSLGRLAADQGALPHTPGSDVHLPEPVTRLGCLMPQPPGGSTIAQTASDDELAWCEGSNWCRDLLASAGLPPCGADERFDKRPGQDRVRAPPMLPANASDLERSPANDAPERLPLPPPTPEPILPWREGSVNWRALEPGVAFVALVPCVAAIGFLAASVYLLCTIRRGLRVRASIDPSDRRCGGGGVLTDCCAATCCFMCVLGQEARKEGLLLLDERGVDVLRV